MKWIQVRSWTISILVNVFFYKTDNSFHSFIYNLTFQHKVLSVLWRNSQVPRSTLCCTDFNNSVRKITLYAWEVSSLAEHNFLFSWMYNIMQIYLWSLNTELSRTIFSRSSMSSLGRSAVMKAFTVTEISSGSWVSERAVWTTYANKVFHKFLCIQLILLGTFMAFTNAMQSYFTPQHWRKKVNNMNGEDKGLNELGWGCCAWMEMTHNFNFNTTLHCRSCNISRTWQWNSYPLSNSASCCSLHGSQN